MGEFKIHPLLTEQTMQVLPLQLLIQPNRLMQEAVFALNKE